MTNCLFLTVAIVYLDDKHPTWQLRESPYLSTRNRLEPVAKRVSPCNESEKDEIPARAKRTTSFSLLVHEHKSVTHWLKPCR